jgi:peptidoglycan/LPS O-acetylase OafA/YrhL
VALILTTACLIAAALGYRFVEMPFLKRKARMAR